VVGTITQSAYASHGDNTSAKATSQKPIPLRQDLVFISAPLRQTRRRMSFLVFESYAPQQKRPLSTFYDSGPTIGLCLTSRNTQVFLDLLSFPIPYRSMGFPMLETKKPILHSRKWATILHLPPLGSVLRIQFVQFIAWANYEK
jgi:hypothetical protein